MPPGGPTTVSFDMKRFNGGWWIVLENEFTRPQVVFWPMQLGLPVTVTFDPDPGGPGDLIAVGSIRGLVN